MVHSLDVPDAQLIQEYHIFVFEFEHFFLELLQVSIIIDCIHCIKLEFTPFWKSEIEFHVELSKMDVFIMNLREF